MTGTIFVGFIETDCKRTHVNFGALFQETVTPSHTHLEHPHHSKHLEARISQLNGALAVQALLRARDGTCPVVPWERLDQGYLRPPLPNRMALRTLLGLCEGNSFPSDPRVPMACYNTFNGSSSQLRPSCRTQHAEHADSAHTCCGFLGLHPQVRDMAVGQNYVPKMKPW